MLTASRAFVPRATSQGRALPHIPELSKLYSQFGLRLSHGQIIMVAGRPGAGKSAFALWLAMKTNLETLYFSADMSAATVTARMAAFYTGDTTAEVHAARDRGEWEKYTKALEQSRIGFSFGSPITWSNVDQYIESHVEVYDRIPELFIFDNLKDIEDCQFDYGMQMEAMQNITELARNTGSTVMVLHHATNKGGFNPVQPPPVAAIKNGMTEQPEVVFGVGLDSNTNEFGVALLKQREGKQDPNAMHYQSLRADPERNRYDAF